MTSFYRSLAFYPELTASEKPALHEAICRGSGCDDTYVLAACMTLIQMKRVHQAVMDAFAVARLQGTKACSCGHTVFSVQGKTLLCAKCGAEAGN